MSEAYNATITLSLMLTPTTMVLRVKPDTLSFAYEPGQYTLLGLERSSPRIALAPDDPPALKEKPGQHLIRRAYSITSNSTDAELEFVVTLVASGSLTPRLFNLSQGSRIYVEPRAMGIFTLQTSSGNRDLLLVATGSALAPYMSMIRTNFPQNKEHQYVIVHAAAVSWDLTFRAQLEAMAEQSPHFTYIPTITEAGQDKHWHGLVGSVEQLLSAGEIEDLLGLPITPERFDAYLSGSPEMIDKVTAVLVERGFITGDPQTPEANIFAERYW